MTNPLAALAGRRLTKGHGTANDFLLLNDPDAEVDLSAAAIAALCDRRRGFGADGLIRVARTEALARAGMLDATPDPDQPQWFMDYRNADGSPAQMCGNGIRVFVHYLRLQGLIDLPEGASIAIATRAGERTITRHAELYTVDMGRWQIPGGEEAIARGADALVTTAGLDQPRAALNVDLGNPHTVVALAEEEELAAAQLARIPLVQPAPPQGTNVEYVVPLGEEDVAGVTVGTVRMRVHERGVGDTVSCGTGCCAAALAVRAWGGQDAPDVWRVLVPGG
ncbi:diaminopimelate epimerase, partial [Paracoccus sp. (in: a-proteobacteria)]|uniref:diaminopimelate epimerase n=1 Tax=Paracoccus sp. TaxID=267 RepID=UPI0026DF2121